MKGAIQQHLNMSSVEKAVVWEGTVITRHVTCGKPLTVLSFAVSIQLPKNLIWRAGRMVWQVKAHVALPDVLIWFLAPMLGSLQLPLMPASEGSKALFGHLSASGLTCTYSHRDIVLENTSLKKKTHLESKILSLNLLRIRYNCAQISWLQRAEAELSREQGGCAAGLCQHDTG